MKHVLLLPLLVVIVFVSAQAGDVIAVPGAAEVAQGLERGKNLRIQNAVIPDALMKTAVILKAGDVRCGFTLVKIADAHGEGGATYKLTERIKGAVPRGIDTEVIEYVGTLMLDADLGLRSGTQVTTKTVTSAKGSESETVSAEIIVKGGELSWVRKEKRAGDPEFVDKSEPVKLNGIHPIPHNALICLAAFAANEPGFKAGVSSPFCVPSLDTGGTIDTFLIQPIWVETVVPIDRTNPTAKLLMRLHILEGELNEKGLHIEPPSPETWTDTLDWTFDAKFHIGALPTNPDTLITAEMVDADKLDINMPLDFGKIRDAIKVLEAKVQKQKDQDGVTPIPLK
jgi:hypothetical protein